MKKHDFEVLALSRQNVSNFLFITEIKELQQVLALTELPKLLSWRKAVEMVQTAQQQGFLKPEAIERALEILTGADVPLRTPRYRHNRGTGEVYELKGDGYVYIGSYSTAEFEAQYEKEFVD